MSEAKTYDVPDRVRDGSEQPIHTFETYLAACHQARVDPDRFWLEQTRARLTWHTPPTMGLQGGYHDVALKPFTWFADGRLNITETCLDAHLATRADKTAILWEGDEPGQGRTLTYRELHAAVGRAANALRALGVDRGDRVIIYMGMVPEAAIAMLACARLGAVHSVVFGGFSAHALSSRIEDCRAEVVITQDQGMRGGKALPLKSVVDAALAGDTTVRRVLVYRRTGAAVEMKPGRDVWWHDTVDAQSPDCAPVIVDAEHPLFILYTSGSTGKPKGLQHTCAGYLTYAAFTHRTVFDLREDDVYACVADVGWVTGHSYIVYGPLANGATTLMFESTPMYPGPDRYWDLVARHKVTIFYTAPTALRALAAHGEAPVMKHDLSSLRVLGTVGEPINPDAWEWYHRVVGQGRCNIVDTWWQTETGGILISPIAPATPTRPGSATFALPGIWPAVLDPETGRPLRGPGEGHLVITEPWPGQARTIHGDHRRFVETYFQHYAGYYFTGDGCRRDADGYYWITGRIDDVLNVSGHRMGTAEFESALVSHEAVAEAAVVGYPHAIKGQGVYAYVVLQPGARTGDAIEAALHATLRQEIGAVAKVDVFQFVPGLPKTRSGKVMRRILRKIAEGRADELGDITTLADPDVVDAIRAGAKVDR